MAQLYRKALLDRLSSPEQLDRMIVITSPSFWVAVVGAALVVLVAVIWSIFGRLPVKVESNGIYMNSQGVDLIYSDVAGKVDGIQVEPGQQVTEGQLLLTIDGQELYQEILSLEERLADVDAVTLESVGDRITVDNKDLLSIKAQITSAYLQLNQNKMTLEARRAELNEQKGKVDKLYDELLDLRADYYSRLGRSATSSLQLEYEDAQSIYNQQSGSYESAAGEYSGILSNYQAFFRENVNQIIGYYEAQLESSPGDAQLSAWIAALQGLAATQDPANYPAAAKNALDALDDSLMTQLKEGWAAVTNAKKTADTASDRLKKAYNNMLDARDDYYNYADRQNALAADRDEVSVRYSDLYNEYSSQYSLLVNLEQTVHSLETQVVADSMAADTQNTSYIDQFMTLKAATMDSLERELDKYNRSFEKNRVVARQDGVVSEVLTSLGAVIGQGSELVRLQPDVPVPGDSQIICYIPVSDGKKVTEGMTVIVYPSTVNRQEYGHMEAQVISVDSYVTSTSSMKNFLGDEGLVNAFASNGPVVAVTCQLRTDPDTASGYYWSSHKGADQLISEGTIVTVDIVTEYKKPISMVIPLLKEKLSVRVKNSSGNNGNGGRA